MDRSELKTRIEEIGKPLGSYRNVDMVADTPEQIMRDFVAYVAELDPFAGDRYYAGMIVMALHIKLGLAAHG